MGQLISGILALRAASRLSPRLQHATWRSGYQGLLRSATWKGPARTHRLSTPLQYKCAVKAEIAAACTTLRQKSLIAAESRRPPTSCVNMRRKPSAIGKGGISQRTWEYMHPQTRRIYNQIYPDDQRYPYGGVYFALADIQALVNREIAILAQFTIQPPHHICYRVVAMDGSNPNHTGLRARAQ